MYNYNVIGLMSEFNVDRSALNSDIINLVGDIHGAWGFYCHIIGTLDHPSIQLGDYGMGLVDWDEDKVKSFFKIRHLYGSHLYIRGNHDNPMLCMDDPWCIKDGTLWEQGGQKLMAIGGANSIDKAWRTIGLDWWPNEELTYGELCDLFDIYERERPNVMFTHTCPTNIIKDVFPNAFDTSLFPSVTQDAFGRMFEEHQPDLWVFGHWHEFKDINLRGTRFVCLPINGVAKLNIPELEIEFKE